MDLRAQYRGLRTLALLEQAVAERARARLTDAEMELQTAQARSAATRDQREDAAAFWRESFAMARPDPTRLTLTRRWLAQQDSRLVEAELDQAIAERSREARAGELARERAHVEVLGKLAQRTARQLEKQSERQVMAVMDDHYRRGHVA